MCELRYDSPRSPRQIVDCFMRFPGCLSARRCFHVSESQSKRNPRGCEVRQRKPDGGRDFLMGPCPSSQSSGLVVLVLWRPHNTDSRMPRMAHQARPRRSFDPQLAYLVSRRRRFPPVVRSNVMPRLRVVPVNIDFAARGSGKMRHRLPHGLGHRYRRAH